jgi:hypothetical protein
VSRQWTYESKATDVYHCLSRWKGVGGALVCFETCERRDRVTCLVIALMQMSVHHADKLAV